MACSNPPQCDSTPKTLHPNPIHSSKQSFLKQSFDKRLERRSKISQDPKKTCKRKNASKNAQPTTHNPQLSFSSCAKTHIHNTLTHNTPLVEKTYLKIDLASAFIKHHSC
jgi:hypothetical protein